MADHEYIIQILLRARDDTAKAFAEATGNVEAYDKLIEEQKAHLNKASEAHDKYSKAVTKSTFAEKQHQATLAKLSNEYKTQKPLTDDAVQKLAKLERAQERVTKLQNQRSTSTTALALATSQLAQAQEELAKELEKEEGVSKRASEIESRRINNIARTRVELRLLGEENARVAKEEQKRAAETERSRQREVDAERKAATARLAEQDRLARESRAREQKATQEYERQLKKRTSDAEKARNQEVKTEHISANQRLANLDRAAKEAQKRQEQVNQEAERARAAQERSDNLVRQRRQSILRSAEGPADVISRPTSSYRQEEEALRRLRAAHDALRLTGLSEEESEKRLNSVRQQSLKHYGFESQAVRDATVALEAQKRAIEDVVRARLAVTSVRKKGGVIHEDTENIADTNLGGLTTIGDKLQMAGKEVSDFSGNVKGIGAVMGIVIGPAITLITGLVGAFMALGSSAIAAGSAVGVTFMSAITQGLPAVGLFAAALQRLSQITQYVSALHQQLEQRFIAAYQAAYETRLGINQVTIAEHNYSDALFAQQQAVVNLRVSQLSLLATRQQATRQLQDLIFQEEQARLAAEASSLSIVDAQKALRQAIATGGDVAAAQLQLHEAQAGHQQAVVQAQRAVSDASKGSIARQQISEQVAQAGRAVTESRRAIVDAQYASAQARAAIIQARQAAAGFNVGIAAQLAWLRSQMTATEKSLAGNIQRIFQMFTGVHGKLRPFTDAILSAFIPLTSQIIKLFNRRDFMGALLNLSKQIGNAIRTVTHTLFSNQAIQGFIKLINAAAANMAPFARIVSGFLKSVGAISQAAIPFVHQLMEFIARGFDKFSAWAASAKGQNALADFFREAFKALEAFMKLGGAVINLFAAIIGPGGGNREGLKLIDDLTKRLNNLADSINSGGHAATTLKELWSTVMPTLHDLRIVFDAIFHAFIQIASSQEGKNGLRNLADLVAHQIVPAFVQWAKDVMFVVNAITGFLRAHPALARDLIQFAAAAFAFKTISNVVRTMLGPVGLLLTAFGKIFSYAKGIKDFIVLIKDSSVWTKLRGFFGSERGSINLSPMEKAASTQESAAKQMDVAADKMQKAAADMNTAATEQDTAATDQKVAADEQATAADTQATAAETETTAAATQEAAATEQVAGGGAAALGGGELGAAGGGLAAGGASGLLGTILAPLALLAGAGLLLKNFVSDPISANATAWQKSRNLMPGQLMQGGFGVGNQSGGNQGFRSALHTFGGNSYAAILAASLTGGRGAETGAYPGLLGVIRAFNNPDSGTVGTPGQVAGGVKSYLQKFIPSAQQLNLITSSSKALASVRERAIELTRLHDITSPMRKSLNALIDRLDPLNIAIKKAGALWGQTFQSLGVTVPHVVNRLKDQLNQDQKAISSNFNKGTQGWTTNMIGVVQAAIDKLKPLAAAGVKGAREELDKLEGRLQKLYSQFDTQFSRVNKRIQDGAKAIGGAIGKMLGGVSTSFAHAGEQALQIIGGVNFGKQAGGPIGYGYGGGDRVPVLAEAGEHMWTKEEVHSAGGHGAMYAMRRAFGGGGQGGPRRYQGGGVIAHATMGTTGTTSSSGPLGSVASVEQLLAQQQQGHTTQGVYGPLGEFLGNLKNFVNEFVIDWKSLWQQLNDVTANNIKVQNNDLTAWMNTMKGIWGQINTNTKDSLHNLVNNIHGALTNVDQSINKAFQYVVNATNASLKAFNAKPVKIDLGSIPKFASGFVGHMGERGKDAIPALLGRGEAVLNYAHQHMVEPAMRAYYGFGLHDMFGKVRGLHAGTKEEARGYASGRAGGGYQFPFSGSGWGWDRTDQGVDFGGNSPIGAIGPGVVTYSKSNDGWYPPAPAFMVYKLTGGPDAGKYIYVAEHITNMAPQGTKLKAGQAVAQMVGGIEMGWAAGPQGHQIVLPMGANHLTSAGEDFHNFLIGLTHGVITGGNFGGGVGAGPSWKKVKDLIVKGSGPMKDLVHGAIKKVIDSANKFGGDKAGSFAGSLGIPTGLSGTVMKQMFQAGIKLGLNKVAIAGMIGNAFQESSLNPSLNDSSGKGLFSWTSGFGPDYARIALGNVGQQMALAVRWLASNGYLPQLKAAASPAAAAVYFENVFENAGTPVMANRIAAAQRAFAQGYASGGVVGHKKEEGAPVPIVAHVGEWVLNRMQQSKLATMVGTSISRLQSALGFSGGPTNFADGGPVEAASPPPLPSSFYPSVQKSGIFPVSLTALDIPAFYSRIIATFLNEGKFIVRKVEEHGGHLIKGINDFIKNLAQATGDSGIFALAAQAVNDYVTHLQTNLSLALAGVRDIRNKLIFGAIPTALEGTTKTMKSLRSQGQAFEHLHGEDQKALRQINEQLRQLAKGGVTKAERPLYQQLLGARKNMLTQLGQVDQSIAQNLTDRFDAATTAFQTQIDQYMRSGGYLFPTNARQRRVDARLGRFTLSGGDYHAATAIARTGESARQYVEREMGGSQAGAGSRGLSEGTSEFRKRVRELRTTLGKIGPGIAAGIAAMNQSIAQTLGDPRREITADRSVTQAAYGTRDALRKAYDQAAKKAAKDPRWQKVADDLLTQLQSAQESVVQAQAQALQDRISKTDTRAQLQSAAIDMRNRLVQASVALGRTTQLGGIREQVGISRENRANLASQLTNYRSLYDVAAREGNVQAMHDLTTKMEDLRAQIKEADVNTQQLVTSLRQTALTIVTNQAQTSGSFFQAGANIIQTLGQITGSLNLPQLIAVAKETGQNLVTGAQQISHSIQRTLDSPHALGAFRGQAGALITPLLAAFQQGPQAFAMELTKLGPSLAKLESKMPPDVAALFQGMIDSMIGNTQATVDNTQNLQNLNATTNQQNFASSAWTMFRQAIFTGLGTLLPTYATTVPAMDVGGILTKDGLLYGHRGEVITPANVRKGDFASATGGDNHFHFTEPMEVADPVYLGNAIAFRLGHDPNSR